MYKTLWEVINESKQGKPYQDSDTQYYILYDILSKLSKANIKAIQAEWEHIESAYVNNGNFMLFHKNYEGIVEGGDDKFYMDFSNWLVAQGEELFEAFQKVGIQPVLDYIQVNNIPESDYGYECMAYVFQDLLPENYK